MFVVNVASSPPYDLKNPYLAEIKVNRELMKGGTRNCMHIEVQIKDTPLSYQSGDHLGIFPMNNPEEVENLGKRLGIANLDQLFTMTALDCEFISLPPLPQLELTFPFLFFFFSPPPPSLFFSIRAQKAPLPCPLLVSHGVDVLH